MIYHIQNIFSDVGSIASFLTISVTLMGAVALLLANFARYAQAKKYGIPVKAVSQATMGDSAAIWILLIRAIGFGVLVPIVMLNVDWPWWAVLIVGAVSFYFALTSHIEWHIFISKEKVFRGKTYYVTKDYAYLFLAILAVITAAAYLPARAAFRFVTEGGNGTTDGFIGHFGFFVGALFVAIHVIVLVFKFYIGIKTIVYGGAESMVVEIEGQKYLVAMRNSHYHWILVPCEPHIEILKRYKNGSYRSRHYLYFIEGTFIVRDMSTIDAPIKRMMDYEPVKLGVPAEDIEEEYKTVDTTQAE